MEPVSLYLHIPFCVHRCGYCDFNTYAGKEELMPAYMQALGKEVECLGKSSDGAMPVHTIYFGGGTPSLVQPNLIRGVLEKIDQQFEILPGAEITLEVNPGTVNLAYFQALIALGVNRLSIGMQSADDDELQMLERQHTYRDVVKAFDWARQAGFENLSLDLIFGLPYQQLNTWQRNLSAALALDPEHVSLYALTVEHGTPLEQLVLKGDLPRPDADLAAGMYEWTMLEMGTHGFVQYEISNWARVDKQQQPFISRHNTQYWLNQAYLGLGAGAHGFCQGVRTANVLAPGAYIKRMDEEASSEFPNTPATADSQKIDQTVEMQETMMMGLRLLNQGVSSQRFFQRFGKNMGDVFFKEINELTEKGLVLWGGEDGKTLLLSERGKLLGNQVFMQFV